RWVEILGGQYVPAEFQPLSMAYAGHQFGQWAGQLGDGRGLLMAQVLDKNNQLQDIHLKGAGLTPYSRMGDGRAVLRSTIREYLCGHALTQLGIASSNALGFVVSDTKVRRERIEAGAALMRVADSHIRLGHVEWIASFAPDLLAEFTDYMIDTYYPECRDSDKPVLAFLQAVVELTARMIADWQLIGFAHGVMNTDNLSITGSTLDFGPFGFMERFNPAWI
ncbi:protein adenylyltransferase SelO family protein, partial [Psychrobacter sp. 16-Bac2893]